jgi:peroxiredoxin
MKSLFYIALITITTGVMAFNSIAELPIGADMPNADVRMKDVNGKQVSLNEAKKKNGLLVMFTCNTCPYVVKNQSRTLKVSNAATKNDIGVILVNSNEGSRIGADSYIAMQAYAKDQGYKWHYVVDEKSALADAFGANRTPETFLFDSKGKLVYHGAIDDNPTDDKAVTRKHLNEAMVDMVGGKDVSVKTSRSVGCGIKRLK